jgi:hypothetical protein
MRGAVQREGPSHTFGAPTDTTIGRSLHSSAAGGLVRVTAQQHGHCATEDDVSVLWLKKGVSVSKAVNLLEQNATAIGMGEIYYGGALALNYNVGGWNPGEDSRTPDIIVTPNVGVTYSGSTSMIGDHGGFAHDDTDVTMLAVTRREPWAIQRRSQLTSAIRKYTGCRWTRFCSRRRHFHWRSWAPRR